MANDEKHESTITPEGSYLWICDSCSRRILQFKLPDHFTDSDTMFFFIQHLKDYVLPTGDKEDVS